MKSIKWNLDFLLFALVAGTFLYVAAQRLGTVPVPEGDEAFTLQVPYEMIVRGKLALPMLRYLGGNIENVWHSFTPVCFLIMSGFFKLVGFGVTEGRAFNLITAVTTLLMVFLIGRRLFDWRAGLVAVVMLVGDQTFLERSRLLRNDYAAATFALLAFYLFEIAEEHNSWRYYIASGLAAGAGVMCHTNILYIIVTIGLMILIRGSKRTLISKKLFLFGASAFAVMAYEIVYDIIDYRNFRLQNRGDDLHFRIFEVRGWLQNILEERLRYQKWFAGGSNFPDLPHTTLKIFQVLTAIAIVYLFIISARRLMRGKLIEDPRARILIATTVVVLFHAIIVSHKRIYYLAHLAPWFALCVGVITRDIFEKVSTWRSKFGGTKLIHRAAVIAMFALMAGYSYLLATQWAAFVSAVRNPRWTTFGEYAEVLREIVPADLCPVALQNPCVWLVFPEKDSCFATLEARMANNLDIDGKDYAYIRRSKQILDSPEVSEEGYHLLGELNNTAYGNIVVYYTGNNPRYKALTPKRYSFFGDLAGHVAKEPRPGQP